MQKVFTGQCLTNACAIPNAHSFTVYVIYNWNCWVWSHWKICHVTSRSWANIRMSRVLGIKEYSCGHWCNLFRHLFDSWGRYFRSYREVSLDVICYNGCWKCHNSKSKFIEFCVTSSNKCVIGQIIVVDFFHTSSIDKLEHKLNVWQLNDQTNNVKVWK